MKFALGLVTAGVLQFTALAADTAYSALRVVGKQSGEKALNHVVEVRGRAGAPEPAVWKITLDEPNARGGVRELEVQRGKVISEKTPIKGAGGPPMNFTQLNLDSEGVFTLANTEAKKANITFDRVDYMLRASEKKGAPVWHLELFDSSAGRVGALDIAADTGTIQNHNWDKHPSGPAPSVPPPPAYSDDRAYLHTPPTPARPNDSAAPPPPAYGRDEPRGYSEERGEYARPEPGDDDYNGPGFFERVANHFKKRKNQFQNFFTGRGWTAADPNSGQPSGR
jgi:hypothetical protein